MHKGTTQTETLGCIDISVPCSIFFFWIVTPSREIDAKLYRRTNMYQENNIRKLTRSNDKHGNLDPHTALQKITSICKRYSIEHRPQRDKALLFTPGHRSITFDP